MGLYFEDYERLAPGHTWTSETRRIAESDIAAFAQLTGDDHPQHLDERYARASPYGARIAHGYLTASVASGLSYRIGLDEGTSHAILEITWKFPRPVKVGDVIHVVLTLGPVRESRKHPSMGIVVRRYDVLNQDGEVVALGEITVLCKRSSAGSGALGA